MGKIFFANEDIIINPCWDNVFKVIFTKDTPESRIALKELLSTIIRRKLTVVAVTTNEPPVDNLRDRQIRYDINCKFDDGELGNIEMTLNPDKYEAFRLEYYVGRLHTSQDIRGIGKSYRDLKNTYQISILANKPIIDDDEFIHEFKYYDEERRTSLNGRTCIITVELSKLESIAQKRVEDMSSLERWAVFFRYTPDNGKRELVNEIMEHEEGIAMAGQVLLTISKDEAQRARMISEYKYEVDLQSKLVTAERIGREEGRQEGRQEGEIIGMERGRQEGIQEGEYKKSMEVVKKMLRMGISEEQAAEAVGLNVRDVIKLKK